MLHTYLNQDLSSSNKIKYELIFMVTDILVRSLRTSSLVLLVKLTSKEAKGHLNFPWQPTQLVWMQPENIIGFNVLER